MLYINKMDYNFIVAKRLIDWLIYIKFNQSIKLLLNILVLF